MTEGKVLRPFQGVGSFQKLHVSYTIGFSPRGAYGVITFFCKKGIGNSHSRTIHSFAKKARYLFDASIQKCPKRTPPIIPEVSNSIPPTHTLRSSQLRQLQLPLLPEAPQRLLQPGSLKYQCNIIKRPISLHKQTMVDLCDVCFQFRGD